MSYLFIDLDQSCNKHPKHNYELTLVLNQYGRVPVSPEMSLSFIFIGSPCIFYVFWNIRFKYHMTVLLNFNFFPKKNCESENNELIYTI